MLFRSIFIDEFLEMMRNYKKEKQREKKIKAPEQVKENREKVWMEEA